MKKALNLIVGAMLVAAVACNNTNGEDAAKKKADSAKTADSMKMVQAKMAAEDSAKKAAAAADTTKKADAKGGKMDKMDKKMDKMDKMDKKAGK